MSIPALTAESARLLAYFQGAESSIESRVSAAVAAVPSNVKKYYVDAINGSDTAAGGQGSPLRTLNRALVLIYGKSGLSVEIVLVGDLNYSLDVDCVVHNSSVTFSGSTAGVKPSVRLVHRVRNYLGGANAVFAFSGENLSIIFNGVTLIAANIPEENDNLPLYPHQGVLQLDNGGKVRVSSCDLVLGDLPLFQLSGPVNSVWISASHISASKLGVTMLKMTHAPVILLLNALILDAPLSIGSIVTGRSYSSTGYPLNFTSNHDFAGV